MSARSLRAPPGSANVRRAPKPVLNSAIFNGEFRGRRARKQVARRSIGYRQTFDRYSGGNPTILDRAHSVLVSSRRRAASTGPGRAPLVNWGICPQLHGSYLVFVAILESIKKKYGCYGPPGMLSCTSRNSHAHRRTQAGRWAKPARVSAECRPGVGRASTDLLIIDWNSDGARPYVERASLDSR